MFVADFIGSPPMNFLPFRSGLRAGAVSVRVNGAEIAVPKLAEDMAETELALGVRPEHIRFDDSSRLRGTVFGAEYLGTTQIVTVTTEHGPVKARLPADMPARPGETVGLSLRPSGCRSSTGSRARALRTALHEEARPWLRSRSPASPSASGTVTAVDGVDLTIADGEFFVLLGPTGAGKTTTLRLVAGLEKADAGRIAIAGHDVTTLDPAARDVAFVFQQFSLYPHLTAYDNLAFPLRSPARRVPEAEIKRRVEEIAAMLRIARQARRTARRSSPAARCSAWRSAGRSSGGRRST